MTKQTRKNFLISASLFSTWLAGSAFTAANKKDKPQLLHHVFFWLKNPGSKEDLNKLIEGLRTLGKIDVVQKIHIGVPASTEKRPVVDNSYNISALSFFDDLAGQKTYQDHPIHLKFVEDYSKLWEKVIVYDSTDL